jgi:hypothetical protein
MGGRDAGSDDRTPSAAQPGVYPGGGDEPGGPTFTLDVDGEQFSVRVAERPGYSDTGYTWLSGPNKGYGFGTSGPSNPSLDDHRANIRGFLAMVDPATGYIEED